MGILSGRRERSCTNALLNASGVSPAHPTPTPAHGSRRPHTSHETLGPSPKPPLSQLGGGSEGVEAGWHRPTCWHMPSSEPQLGVSHGWAPSQTPPPQSQDPWTLPAVKHPSEQGEERREGEKIKNSRRKKKNRIIQPFPSLFCFDLPHCHTGGTCSSQVNTELSKDEEIVIFCTCLPQFPQPSSQERLVFLGAQPRSSWSDKLWFYFFHWKRKRPRTKPAVYDCQAGRDSSTQKGTGQRQRPLSASHIRI